MTNPSSKPIERVKRADKARRDAEAEWRAALVAAYEAGCSYAELGRLLGLSRQAVRQAAGREPRH